MAQAGGLMNTAPSPIPGGGSNPAGMNIGLPNASKAPVGAPAPFGAIPTTYSPSVAAGGAPSSLFPANGFSTDPSGGMAGLSSGTGFTAAELKRDPNLYADLSREFVRAYGRGTGMQLFNMITNGLFNPQVANAMINAMQPMRTRGLNDIQNSFGAAGARFSSAAAIGEGDFESQFAANEQATLANMFQKDQALQLQLLESTLPTMQAEQANHSSGILSTIFSALGPAAALIPGIGPAISAIMSGAGKIMGSKGGSGGSSGSAGGDLKTSISDILGLFNNSSKVTGMPESTPSASPDAWKDIMLSSSAGSAIGGVDSNSSDMNIVPFL